MKKVSEVLIVIVAAIVLTSVGVALFYTPERTTDSTKKTEKKNLVSDIIDIFKSEPEPTQKPESTAEQTS